MGKPCIVFDLDDTLYLERDYVHSGFTAVGAWAAAALNVPDCADRAWQAFQSGVRGSIFQTVLAEAGRTPEAHTVEEMVRVYRTHPPTISLLPDSLHCLHTLRPHATLAIITDGIACTQNLKCESLSLSRLVDLIVCTGEWGREYYKPHPRAFRYVEEQLQPRPSGFVYVADNPAKDFQTPVASGWKVIRVRRPEGIYSSLECPAGVTLHAEVPDLWNVAEIAMQPFSL
jgi:putative hydrolase of the HAD superfamily